MSGMTIIRNHLETRYANAANVVLADFKVEIVEGGGASTLVSGKYTVMLQPVAAVPSPPPIRRAHKSAPYYRETFLLHYLGNTRETVLDGALRMTLEFAENEVAHLASQELVGITGIEFVGMDVQPRLFKNSTIAHAQARMSVDVQIMPTGVEELKQRDYFDVFPPTHVDITGTDTYSFEIPAIEE